MHEDESVAKFFLRVDEIVNTMKGHGAKLEDSTVVLKILRSLTPKFEAKLSAIK